MKAPDYVQVVRLEDVEGFQHAKDNYWYRPLIFSENLFTYVAHIPPGGFMPAHDDGHVFETSLYMIEGKLEVTFQKDVFDIEKDMALHVPGGAPFGVRNNGEVMASYVLTFHPPPDIESIEALRKRYDENEREYKSVEEMRELLKGS
jgi:glyoxylate utilization-related uncharacterized protein